jgi:hypothetical protein
LVTEATEMSDSLAAELQFYEEKRAEWVPRHEGKFALVKDRKSLGFFDNAEAACIAGWERFGDHPFLVKRVQAVDGIEQIPALVYGLIREPV